MSIPNGTNTSKFNATAFKTMSAISYNYPSDRQAMRKWRRVKMGKGTTSVSPHKVQKGERWREGQGGLKDSTRRYVEKKGAVVVF